MKLPEPDTHCFDMDTDTNVWSYSREQMIELRKATIEECALFCDSTWNGDSDTYAAHEVYKDCAESIRSMDK